jgi:RHS repeat-associated protein
VVIKEVEYTYDLFNKRIGVTVDADGAGGGAAVDRWTVYDGDNAYADFDDGGSLETRYLYGTAIDQLLARVDVSADSIAWYLTDHLGSVRDIVGTTGAVLDHIEYDSFGNVLAESNPGAGDRFKYTGREWDDAVDLYFYRARYYDPAIGRFISEDPVGFGGGDANIYRYVGNGVMSATDPSGLEEESRRNCPFYC